MGTRAFRDQQTSYQIERFKAKPSAGMAVVFVEVTIERFKVWKVDHATAAYVLRIVADFFIECAAIAQVGNSSKI